VTWILHHGDCLDPVAGLASLEDKSVDVTGTDPPYEVEAHTEQRRQTPGTKYANAKGWRAQIERGGCEPVAAPLNFGAITPAQRKDVAAQIARVTRQRAFVFCQAEAIDAWRKAFDAAGMPYRRSMVWIKPDAMPSLHGRWPGQAFESIVIAQHKSARPPPIGGKAKFYVHTRARAGQPGGPGGTQAPHPTTKPLPLMLELVADFSYPGDLILDPFAGSGTTAIAALMLGRRFVGWERDGNYHAIATRRINGDEAKPREEQPSLFGAIGGAR
jgi:site-specific DNA-methyltransferase (adenine-specific)